MLPTSPSPRRTSVHIHLAHTLPTGTANPRTITFSHSNTPAKHIPAHVAHSQLIEQSGSLCTIMWQRPQQAENKREVSRSPPTAT